MWKVQQATSFTREAKVQRFSGTLWTPSWSRNYGRTSSSRGLISAGLVFVDDLAFPCNSSRMLGLTEPGCAGRRLGVLLIDAANLTFHWDVKAPRTGPPSSWLPQSPTACWADALSPVTLLVMRRQGGGRRSRMKFQPLWCFHDL